MIRKVSKKNYLDFDNVDRNNQFFIKIFKNQNNVFYGKKCQKCDQFLPNSGFTGNHDFLFHCGAGRNVFEEQPVNYTNLREIRKYEITIAQHLHDYEFSNAEKLVDYFLLNVKHRIGRSSNDFLVKYGFPLESIQLYPIENEQPFKNSRYWSTESGQINYLIILFILI